MFKYGSGWFKNLLPRNLGVLTNPQVGVWESSPARLNSSLPFNVRHPTILKQTSQPSSPSHFSTTYHIPYPPLLSFVPFHTFSFSPKSRISCPHSRNWPLYSGFINCLERNGGIDGERAEEEDSGVERVVYGFERVVF